MKVLFPGTFNLWHKGHQQLYNEAKKSFDEVVVGIAKNPDKEEHDFDFLKWTLKPVVDNVVTYEGLTSEAAKNNGCDAIVRGIRTLDDCHNEFKMADWNMNLGGIPTWFLYGDPKYSRLSSRDLRGLLDIGVDISDYVDPMVLSRWKHGKFPRGTLFFGKISTGKSTYLKERYKREIVFDCDQIIWEYFTKKEEKDYRINIADSIKDRDDVRYNLIIKEMSSKIRWDLIFLTDFNYEVSVLGNWWKYIPKDIIGKFKIVKIAPLSIDIYDERCEKRGLDPAWVHACHAIYKDPPFWDETIIV